MAEGQFVRTGQFGEFVRRMDERFDHVNELADQRYDNINQRFIEAEKAREQNHLHVNQRFDEMNCGYTRILTVLSDILCNCSLSDFVCNRGASGGIELKIHKGISNNTHLGLNH